MVIIAALHKSIMALSALCAKSDQAAPLLNSNQRGLSLGRRPWCAPKAANAESFEGDREALWRGAFNTRIGSTLTK